VYILKIRGAVKIPDYIQLRDDQFTLLAYFRADRPERALEKLGLIDKEAQFKELIGRLPFGRLEKVNL
jgi:hypothetical protein